LDIKSDVRKFIMDNFMMGRDGEELIDGDSLLDKGIIDSTGVLELVSYIEETFAFAVEDEELVPENLDSIVNIENYINKKKS
jgi:acyl carrier protein